MYLKGVACRTQPLGSSTAVQLQPPVSCHQHGAVKALTMQGLYEADFVKSWHCHTRLSAVSRQMSEGYMLIEAASVCGAEEEERGKTEALSLFPICLCLSGGRLG